MRKVVSYLLLFTFLFPLCASAAPQTGVRLSDEVFAQIEDSFFVDAFGGALSSIELNDTMTFTFVPEPTDGLLPNLFLESHDTISPSEDAEEMVAVVYSIIETAQYLQGELAANLQEELPGAFIFNEAKAESYAETGLGFAIADPALWLWAESGIGVMLPVYFHQQTEGALADEVYILTIMAPPGEKTYYSLYSNPAYVAEYMRHVSLDATASHFELALLVWFVENYQDIASLLPDEQSPVEAEDPQGEVSGQ